MKRADKKYFHGNALRETTSEVPLRGSAVTSLGLDACRHHDRVVLVVLAAQIAFFPSPSLLVFGISHDSFMRGKSQEHLAILFCLCSHRHWLSQPVTTPSSLSTETELMAKQFRLIWSVNKLYVSHEAYSYLSEVAICHWSMTYFSYFKKILFIGAFIYFSGSHQMNIKMAMSHLGSPFLVKLSPGLTCCQVTA